jgi:AraC-like DNA-binding protein
MIYLAGVSITFFLTVLLTGKRNKTLADIILAFWLFFIGFHLFEYYLFITKEIFLYPSLLGVGLPLPLLHGPFLFLYILALTQQTPKKKIFQALHFVPAVIFYLLLMPFLFSSRQHKVSVFHNKGAGYEWYMLPLFIVICLSGVGYVIASLVILRKYKKRIVNEFSNTEKISLNWLRYLIYSIAVIWIFVLAGNDRLIFGSAVLFVGVLGYFGIKQMGIFTNTIAEIKQNNPVLETEEEKKTTIQIEVRPKAENTKLIEELGITLKPKYEKSGLTDVQAAAIYESLIKSITNEKVFTDPELTLGALASKLIVHSNHLSQVINTYEQKNFYDFINFHRIEEFKRIVALAENRNYTLVSLAYDCGFNSKASFNRNFKKVTGLSPSEFLQQIDTPV